MSLYPIIMAGGAGTRLWPVSRKGKPKQVYPLLDKDTMLQKTWKRLRREFSARDIFISTSEILAEEIKGQVGELPVKNLIAEPARRGTAPALALALLKLAGRDPRGTFVFINTDNYIRKEKEFARLLNVAKRVVRKKPDSVLLIGVNPTYPETGYGYIKMGAPALKIGRDEIFEVARFVEKPDLETARKFMARWEYLWNPTLVVSRVDHFLGLYKKHLPGMWKILKRMEQAMGTPREAEVIKKEFVKIKAETVDYGILEKEKNMLVLPGNFGWVDVGHWRAVYEILANSKSQIANRKGSNVCKAGKCVAADSTGNLVYSLSGKLVALAGVKDMILIESENALLLCPKGRAQDVKKLVENLEKKGLKAYL